MSEEYLFRRRNRLKTHFVNTSNVLLYGYQGVSDGAKVTYQVIDSFDWQDETKTSKGYAFPSVGTIARIRGTSDRTVQRHLAELVSARLLTRQERPGQTTVLMIEDVREEEAQQYLRRYVDGGDKNVTPPATNSSPETEESEENEIIVNAVKNDSEDQEDAVESVGRGEEVGKSYLRDSKLNDEDWARREYYAQEMVKVLGDEHSLGCYRAIAENCSAEIIFEALALVKEAARDHKIKKSRGALFVVTVKRLLRSQGGSLSFNRAQPQTKSAPEPSNPVVSGPLNTPVVRTHKYLTMRANLIRRYGQSHRLPKT